MALIGQLNTGHLFDEVSSDTLTAANLNNQFQNGHTTIPTPIGVGDGGTGGATPAAAQKATLTSGYLEAWVEYTDTTVVLGTLPADSFNHNFHLQVPEAFDDTGADEIRLGTAADDNAFFTLTDVSTTGIKTPTAGADAGYNGGAFTVQAEYVGANTDATAGKALVIIEYLQVTTEP